MSRLISIVSLCLLAACHDHSVQLDRFDRASLVSDQPGVGVVTDPGLVNAWGIAVNGGDQVFIAANGTGQISSYDDVLHMPVGFPLPTPDASPFTGVVLNNTNGFLVPGDLGTAPADILTATEDGQVFAYSAAATSAPMLVADLSATNAAFKGIAIATPAGVPTLLLTDFANGRVVELDTNFMVTSTGISSGAFVDAQVPGNFAPFGIQTLGSQVYVTYAEQGDGIDEVDGPGLGMVDAFTLDGSLVTRMATRLELNAPWGVAIAPNVFDDFDNALIVGNFGDGTLHAFDPNNGDFLGTMEDASGNTIVIPGLWGLAFGTVGDQQTLFFAAGPDDESHGLFGKLTSVL